MFSIFSEVLVWVTLTVRMPVSALPNLDHVYAKWEARGPKGPGYLGNTGVRNGVAGDAGLQNGKDSRGGDIGKQRWMEKFGNKSQPLRQRRSNGKTKVLALSTETVSVKIFFCINGSNERQNRSVYAKDSAPLI